MIMQLFDNDVKYLPGQHLKGLRIEKVLGEGRYGVCYLVTCNKDFYILKQLKKRVPKENDSKVHFEEDILRAISHEAIPRFIIKIETEQLRGYLLEYKQGTTFEDEVFIRKHIFTRDEIHDIGKQLISVLRYLHGKGIVHRDIRLPNVLYNGRQIYLIDFGLARWMDNKKYKAEIDFFCLGDFLLHLHYTSFVDKSKADRPWYEELDLNRGELIFLKKLMGVEKKYKNIEEVEAGFKEAYENALIK